MPNATDFFNQLKDANTKLNGVNSRLDGVNSRLDAVEGKLDAITNAVNGVQNAVNQVNATLLFGFSQLVTELNYTNQALFHNDQQNDTIICILEHISKNTCAILNEEHVQTALLTDMEEDVDVVSDLYAATHAEAALIREREEALKKQIEECCPPEVPPPPCAYEPCKTSRPIGPPPQVDPRPPGNVIERPRRGTRGGG